MSAAASDAALGSTADTRAAHPGSSPRTFDRREVLSLAWLASIGVLGGIVVNGLGRMLIHVGNHGLVRPIQLGRAESLPGVGDLPLAISGASSRDRRTGAAGSVGRFWWHRTEAGALALDARCTHMGCLYDFKPRENRFICPCHGATFELDGSFVKGPAPRGLDRYIIIAFDDDGREVARTPEDGSPVCVPPDSTVFIEGDRLIPGEAKRVYERIGARSTPAH